MKNLLSVLLVAFGSALNAQTTVIPDYRFEQALVDLGIDSDGTLNGQIFTADALSVTSLIMNLDVLPNYPYPSTEIEGGYIHDVTGIEAFTNLESLTINFTMIDNIDLSTLVNLKLLNLSNNLLSSIDVSNNIQLEYLNISSGGDMYPYNSFLDIDLSNNTKITVLNAQSIGQINLKNHDSGIPISVAVYCEFCWGGPGFIERNTCIIVDDAALAQDDAFPYSTWTILNGSFNTYSFAETDEKCALSVDNADMQPIKFYPNPVDSGIIHFATADDIAIDTIQVFDSLGRLLFEKNNVGSSVDVSHLSAGNYVMRIAMGECIQAAKIIIK